MKEIITKKAKQCMSKSGPSYDDQPNFVNRDRNQQGLTIWISDGPDGEEDIKSRFEDEDEGKKKKKKKKKHKKEKIPSGSF